LRIKESDVDSFLRRGGNLTGKNNTVNIRGKKLHRIPSKELKKRGARLSCRLKFNETKRRASFCPVIGI